MNEKKAQGKFFFYILQLLMRIPVLQNIRILFYFFDKLVLRFIKKPRNCKCEKKHVLVVFPFALGDCILFLGTMPAFEKCYPRERYKRVITCQQGYENLFKPYFDEVLPLRYTEASVNLGYRITMCRMLRQNYYDIVIDPIGCEECSPNVFVTNAVCAEKKIGVLSRGKKRIQCPKWMRTRIYNEVLQIEKEYLHKLEHYALVWEKLGGSNMALQAAQLTSTEVQFKLPMQYFVVFPSASVKVKQWPVQHFAEITKRIYEEKKYPLVVCGMEKDRPCVNDFLDLLGDIPVYNYVGKTNVEEFIELIGRAELVFTNDTSTYHIAVAKQRKVCVVTGRYNYSLFIDYPDSVKSEKNIAIACKAGECADCNNMCCYKVKDTYPCVLENDVEDVWNLIKVWMNNEDVA